MLFKSSHIGHHTLAHSQAELRQKANGIGVSVEDTFKKNVFLGETAFGNESRLQDYETRLEAAKIAPLQSCFAFEDYNAFFKGGDSITNNYKHHNKKRQMGGKNPIHNHEPGGNVSAWKGRDTNKYSRRHYAIESSDISQGNEGYIEYCSVRIKNQIKDCLKLDDRNKIGCSMLKLERGDDDKRGSDIL